MNFFRLDASIFPSSSVSAEIADLVQSEWRLRHPDDVVVARHLGTEPLPADAWALATAAAFAPESERTARQREAAALAQDLAGELRDADAAVLAVPLYNYGVSQHFKSWVDLVISAAGPTEPLLKGKPTVLVTTLGGGYGPGTPREGWDHSTGYLERILRDVWQADLTVIKRELTMAAVTPGMEALVELANQQHAASRAAAREAGKALSRV